MYSKDKILHQKVYIKKQKHTDIKDMIHKNYLCRDY